MANTIFTQKTTCLKYFVPVSNVHHHLRFSKIKHNPFSFPEKNLSLRFQNDATRKMNMVVYADRTPGGPVDPFPGDWKFWTVSIIFPMVLSFFRGKWGPLLRLEEKVETTIEEAQQVVDIVEDVAEGVDKVAEEAVKHLPEGKLRDTVQFVEKVAEDIDQRAQRAEDALKKVENVEKELESFIESTTHEDNTVTNAATTVVDKERK